MLIKEGGMYKIVAVLGMTLLMVGCATPKFGYTPPVPEKYKNSIVMPYGYDDAWKKLIAAASQSFYAIDTYEKDSGLMTLSFGSGNINAYIDCGTMATNDASEAYVPRLQNAGYSADLNGKMNLLVQSESDSSTRVTVNARYIFRIHGVSQQYNAFTGQTSFNRLDETWSFDSNSVGTNTIHASDAAQGISSQRSCQPTGKVENDVIDAILAI
jgi:hypothetical protein